MNNIYIVRIHDYRSNNLTNSRNTLGKKVFHDRWRIPIFWIKETRKGIYWLASWPNLASQRRSPKATPACVNQEEARRHIKLRRQTQIKHKKRERWGTTECSWSASYPPNPKDSYRPAKAWLPPANTSNNSFLTGQLPGPPLTFQLMYMLSVSTQKQR